MNAKEIRKDLHQIPEIAKQEFETKNYIVRAAEKMNCRIYEPTETSVVLYFDAKMENTICFRADMDALAIEEKTNLPFCSKRKGFMHACGHDGHMAMLLDFAFWADKNINKLKNNIVCLFQPSEEENAGAWDILNSNILDELNVKRIFGMHIWPGLEENKLFTMPNGMLASSCEVNILIHGKSVHAANFNKGIDAIRIAAKLIDTYYAEMDKLKKPHLVHFGKIRSGNVRNIVSDLAIIEGSLRAFDEDTFTYMEQALRKLAQSLEKQTGCKIELQMECLYPIVWNTLKLVGEYQNILKYSLLIQPFLQAEDFGCYTKKYESLFLLLGCGNRSALHSDTFDFDMKILETGVKAYKAIATHKIES